MHKPENPWEGQVGLSTPAPWVQGYQERAKKLQLVPPSDMYGLGPFGGSCCENWQATWNARAWTRLLCFALVRGVCCVFESGVCVRAVGIPGQAFADDRSGKLLSIPEDLHGAHRIYLRGEHQGHGTPIVNCNALGPTDPFDTSCCSFCGEEMAS